MEPPRLSRRPPYQPPLSPAERFLAAHTALVVVFVAWAGGGRLPWATGAFLFMAVLGLPAVWLRAREDGGIRLQPFVPLALWSALLAIELMNPSHVANPHGGWWPRTGWISWLPTTVDRAFALHAALPWLAALLEGGIIAAVRPSPRVGRFLWTVAAFNGFALAAIGAAFHFAQADTMLGIIAVPERGYFFATFFYKNHWAAYGALCAATGIVLALDAWEHARPGGDPHARGRVMLFSAISLLTAVTLPLPGSRSGALLAVALAGAWLVGLLVGLHPSRRRARRRRALTAALLIGVGALIVGYGFNAYRPRARVDMERTVRQLAQAANSESIDLRWLVSGDTWRMAMERPWFGWGIGSFEIVFPQFQGRYLRDAAGRPEARFQFAHDDWLQALAETGVTGLAVLLLPVLILTRRAGRRGRNARRIVLGCGAIAAFAWFDFPFNNPAVLLLWTVLLVTAALDQPDPGAQSLARA